MRKYGMMPVILTTLSVLLISYCVTMYAGSADAAETNDDWLHVEGNNIVDKDGNKVWLTGANWFGFNCRERMLLDSYHSNIIADIEMVADKGINVVRIPIATELLYAWSQGVYPASTDTSYNNADLAGLNSFELFNLMLANFKRVGIKIILDVHSAETDNQGHTHPVWFKGSITEATFKSAWVWVANHYKNDDTIIGFDLKNEPHTNSGTYKIVAESAIWDDSDRATNWKRVAQETALLILNVHPNALIFVEGVEMYPKDGVWDDAQFDTSPWTGTNDYYGNWWGGNLRGVRDYPINLGKYQQQLVYSPHDYGPLVYEQEWFKGDFITADDAAAQKILYEKCWKDNWGYIMEEGISPLLLGEWGGLTEGTDKLLELNKKYLRAIRDYIVANKYKLHHTFWCINIDSADTGGLFTRGEGTAFTGGRDLKWNDNKYDNYLLPTLWRNSEGKFIGLDHKVPLGKNGVALGSGPVSSEGPTTSPSPSKSPTPSPSSTPSLSPSPSKSPTPSPSLTPSPSPTPSLSPSPSVTPTGAVAVTYAMNDWGSGATVSMTVKNNSTKAISGWELVWTFAGNQKLANMWNASYSQSGSEVTVKSLAYNAAIPVGGSVSFGFNLTYSGSNAKPAEFTLNGTVCEIE